MAQVFLEKQKKETEKKLKTIFFERKSEKKNALNRGMGLPSAVCKPH